MVELLSSIHIILASIFSTIDAKVKLKEKVAIGKKMKARSTLLKIDDIFLVYLFLMYFL